MRLIPGKTKVKIELFKGITFADIIVALVGLGIAALCAVSSLPARWAITIIVISIFGMLLVRVNDEPLYIFFWHMLRYNAFPKRLARVYNDKELERMSKGNLQEIVDEFYDEEGAEEEVELDPKEEKKRLKEIIKAENKILKDKKSTKEEQDEVWKARAQRSAEKKKKKSSGKEENSKHEDISGLMPFTGIKDNFIEYAGQYVGAVVEIDPVEFRFFSQHRRNNSIEACFGRILRSMAGEFGVNIVKIQRPIVYDSYLTAEYNKLDNLKKSYESGLISEEELKARVEVEYVRINEIEDLCTENKVIESFFYLVLFDRNRNKLNSAISQTLDILEQGELPARRLDSKGLALFLKYSNSLDFDEKQINRIDPEHWFEWAMPEKVRFTPRKTIVNNMISHNLRVISYPAIVGDAWLAGVMSFPGTKVVVKCQPMDVAKAIRAIDRSLAELRGRYVNTGIDSKRLELQAHIETLSSLLVTLQQENETLLSVNVYVTAYDAIQTKDDPVLGEKAETLVPFIPEMKKSVRHSWSEAGMKLSGMDFMQIQSFIGSQISAYDPMTKESRGIPSNTIAGMYPWIFAHISDQGGVKLGSSDGIPVFINFFRRDAERVNSNMVIVGKSGSGKSYTTKSLLLNLASEDAKIFILDPENEYSELAHNLHGKIINVGNATYGRLNPFHIITALDDDEAGEGGGGPAGSFSTHLQFLEEFFRQILPDIDKDALEYLNSLVERVYLNFGITAETDLSTLHAEDYPIFDDLYDVVLSEFERTNNEYLRQLLRSLVNYISKFSTGGRNANIWNGPSTITTEENFSVFNFQSLLANRNTTIANAQMLLVLKYIDNEIIKNRDYNIRYNLKRKIVVVIDEAHVFIDTKFPVALDFMFQLAKRIRKYNGMQIVITQNIKDFVGSEEIARKSTAIINACQYSFVFGLAPNDMDDLCKLYEKAGGINEQEQDDILNAKRGQAFAIMSPSSRSSFHIDVPDLFVSMFENMDFESVYFSGAEGEGAWEDFVESSRAAHDTNYDERIEYEAEHPGIEEKKPSSISFTEISSDMNIENEEPVSEGRIGAVDRMIAAEETVNRREYELATGRFGGISFSEVDEDALSGNTQSYGSINLQEVDAAEDDYEADEPEMQQNIPYDSGMSGTQYGSLNLTEVSANEYRAEENQVSYGQPVYSAEELDARLDQLRASIRQELEQELLEKLRWISVGAGLAGGALAYGDPGNDVRAAEPSSINRNMDGQIAYASGAAYGSEQRPGNGTPYMQENDFGDDSAVASEESDLRYGEDFYSESEMDTTSDSDNEFDANLDDEFDADLDDEFDVDLEEDADLDDEFDADLEEDADLDDEFDADLDDEFDVDMDDEFDSDLEEDADLDDEFDADLDDEFDVDMDDEFDSDLEEDADLDDEFDADLEEDADLDDEFDADLEEDADLDDEFDADLDDDFDADLEEEEGMDTDFDDNLDDGFDDEMLDDLDDLDDDFDDEDDFEHTPFLFAELLAEAAEEYSNMSLDEQMEESGEMVMTITLDELSEYIRDRNKKKRGA